MLDIFNTFATNTASEEAGVLTPLPGCGDTKWRIARSGNKSYSRKLQKLYKQHRQVLESKGDVADAKAEEILIDVMSTTILLGFEGEILFKGEKKTYTPELGRQLLAVREFRAVVSKAAEDMETFKLVKDADDEGN